MLPILAAITCGAFGTSLLLWLLGFGGEASSEAIARLGRIRNGEGDSAVTTASAASRSKGSSIFRMRRPNSVSFGGMTLVSGKVAAAWAKQLERAGLTLTPREYLVLRLVVGSLFVAVATLLLPIFLFALLTFPVGFAAPSFFVKFRVGQRLKKIEGQMIEMLQMLSSGLRAGFGLQQALEAASEEVPEPLAAELRRAMRDISMGSSVEQSLTALNNRVGSTDFDIVVTAILIQRTVGGNLAEILDTVGKTMREREEIRGQIATLTSQQKLTGIVIGGIPFGLAGFFLLVSPEFIGLLFTEPLGNLMLGGALLLEGMGAFCIKKIVNIEV